jgi:hypothetical protein
MKRIPAEASVAASTPLIPHLSSRQVLVRFPEHWAYQDRTGTAHLVQWIAVDLDYQARYAQAFSKERKALKRTTQLVPELRKQGYRTQTVRDGVALLERGGPINPAAEIQLDQLLQRSTSN